MGYFKDTGLILTSKSFTYLFVFQIPYISVSSLVISVLIGSLFEFDGALSCEVSTWITVIFYSICVACAFFMMNKKYNNLSNWKFFFYYLVVYVLLHYIVFIFFFGGVNKSCSINDGQTILAAFVTSPITCILILIASYLIDVRKKQVQ